VGVEALDLVPNVDDVDAHHLADFGRDNGHRLAQLRRDRVEPLLAEDLLEVVLTAGDAEAVHDVERNIIALRLRADLAHEDHFIANSWFEAWGAQPS